jgi:hypothetical protein
MTDRTRKPTDMYLVPLADGTALSDQELNAVSGGSVGLGLRKSAGNQASGVMFLTFSFKLVAVK